MKKNKMLCCALAVTVSVLGGCSKNAVNKATDESGATTLLTEVKTTQFFKEDKLPNEDIEKILQAGVNAPSAMNTQPWHFTAITDEETADILADAMSSMKPPEGFKAPSEKAADFDKGERPAPPAGENGERPEQPERPSGENEDIPAPPNGEKAPDMEGEKPNFSMNVKKAGIGDAPLTIVVSCEAGAELSCGLAVQNMSAEAQLLGYGTKILTSPTMALNGDRQAEFKEMLQIPDNQKVAAVLIVGVPETEEDNADAVSSATTREDYNTIVTRIGE